MTPENLAPVCGLFCGACEHLGAECRGCGREEGRPFWTAQFGVKTCPLYDCCINIRGLEHCGLCGDLPCDTFLSLRDPSLSDEEAQISLEERQGDLLRRKELGTEKWLEARKALG